MSPHLPNPLPGAVPGMGPGQRDAAVNYNDRILDGLRAATGIPRSYNFGLVVPPWLQPVVVVDPDSPPLLQYKGWIGFDVAASAANFSIAAMVNVGGQGGILKVWLTWQRIVNGGLIRLNDGIATTYRTGGGNGFVETLTPSTDTRLVFNPGGSTGGLASGVALLATKNTTAAPWQPAGSTPIGSFSSLSGAGIPLEAGPFWLDQFDALTVESSVINSQLIGAFRWEYYAPIR